MDLINLWVVRHGNTFTAQQQPLRIGCNIDIPLTPHGTQQALKVAAWLNQQNIMPTKIYTGSLVRVQQTTNIIAKHLPYSAKIIVDKNFNEIDYGKDEGSNDEEIKNRVGAKALDDWQNLAIPIADWPVDRQALIDNWQNFANNLICSGVNVDVLVVTSQGVGRFVASLTDEFKKANPDKPWRLATGSISNLVYKPEIKNWQIKIWNHIPV